MKLAKACRDGCQYAIDVSMPEYRCAVVCAVVCKYREQVCSACGGEGRLYGGHPNDPHPVDLGVCETCGGDGYELLERDEIVPATAEEIKF